MYGPELVFEIFNFEWKHVLTFLSENMAKMQFAQKIHNSKTNKAIDDFFLQKISTRHRVKK